MNLLRRTTFDTCSNWKCMRAHVFKNKIYNYVSDSIHFKVQNTCPSNATQHHACNKWLEFTHTRNSKGDDVCKFAHMNVFQRIHFVTFSNWKCMLTNVFQTHKIQCLITFHPLQNSKHMIDQRNGNTTCATIYQTSHTHSQSQSRLLIQVHTHELVPTYQCWHIFELEMHARTRFPTAKIQWLIESHPLQSSKHMPEQRKRNTTHATIY